MAWHVLTAQGDTQVSLLLLGCLPQKFRMARILLRDKNPNLLELDDIPKAFRQDLLSKRAIQVSKQNGLPLLDEVEIVGPDLAAVFSQQQRIYSL
jgi:hypothetical protein